MSNATSSPRSDFPILVPSGLKKVPPSLDANELFRYLMAELKKAAVSLERSGKVSVLRSSDSDDWVQECLLALWRHWLLRPCLKLKDGKSVHRFAWRVLRNHAARSANYAKRFPQLEVAWTASKTTLLDELYANADALEFEMKAMELEALIGRLDRAVQDVLDKLQGGRANALEMWLNGTTLQVAADASGLSFAQIRSLTRLMPEMGEMRPLLREAREALKSLWHRWPAGAARIQLERVRRLLEDPL